jgi:hypothetical protein
LGDYLFSVTEEFFFSALALLLLLDLEVRLIKLVQAQSRSLQVDFRACCDDIGRVDPSQRNAIDFEGTGHKNGVGNLFEQNNSLSTITSGENNAHSSRCQLSKISTLLANGGKRRGEGTVQKSGISWVSASCGLSWVA